MMSSYLGCSTPINKLLSRRVYLCNRFASSVIDCNLIIHSRFHQVFAIWMNSPHILSYVRSKQVQSAWYILWQSFYTSLIRIFIITFLFREELYNPMEILRTFVSVFDFCWFRPCIAKTWTKATLSKLYLLQTVIFSRTIGYSSTRNLHHMKIQMMIECMK